MIAGDNADPEVLLTPRRWDLSYIRKFMLVFGLISSLFDLATFWILINIFHADEVLFRSAWFI
jgi:Mg2+-importing ATPase